MRRRITNTLRALPNAGRHIKRFLGHRLGEDYGGLIDGNGWIFSQMKSGTTQLCNVLGFYRAAKYGVDAFNFENLEDFGVLRLGQKDFRALGKSISFASRHGEKVFFHTHGYFATNPDVLILQSRNVFDYCVSSYFFHYKNRKGATEINVDSVLDKIVQNFIDCHKMQIEAAKRANKVHYFYYEDTREDEFSSFSRLFKELDDTFSEVALRAAIDAAAPDRLKAHESKIGHAAVASKGTLVKPHFIRSGKVGEGREFFNAAQLARIEDLCLESDVPISGRFRL